MILSRSFTIASFLLASVLLVSVKYPFNIYKPLKDLKFHQEKFGLEQDNLHRGRTQKEDMAELIVKIEQGILQGKTGTDFLGGTFYSFQGIPYAKPPIGPLRFKAPLPPEPWTGVRDATKEGDACYSLHMVYVNSVIGSEDCLFLNVYTPMLPTSPNFRPKPVMVWIHGGGFTSGSGDSDIYGPQFLITQDVVIVTINYRLGALGFLSLDDPKLGVPGNAGLKDQVMALKWIQKNISNFGGDPDNVTIFGESAGGASVHLLVLSPMARGLFHKAIAQSGSALSPWASGQRVGRDLCKHLKVDAKNEEEVLKVLQEVSVEELHKAQLQIKDHFRADLVRPFGPIVERCSPFEEAFLSESPLDLMLQGRYNKVPMIIGFTSREGMLLDMVLTADKQLITDFEEAIPHLLKIEKGTPLSLAVAKKIKNFYYGDRVPSLDEKDTLYKLFGDNMFVRGVYSTAKHHAATSSEPVLLYRFSLDGPLNVFKTLVGIKGKGACHGDDIGYLFKNLAHYPIDPNSIDCECITNMITLWGNFAKSGNPQTPDENGVLNVEWKPVTKDKLNYLDIAFELVPSVNPEQDRMEFWDDICKMNFVSAKL